MSSSIISSAAPVNQLPPELLIRIISLARPLFLPKFRTLFQVAASHVCAYWRAVLLNNAECWSDVTIYSSKGLDYLPEFIARSVTYPLSVRLDVYDWEKELGESARSLDSSFVPFLAATAASLVQEVHRLRRLVVFALDETTALDFLTPFEGLIAPELECLKFIVERNHDSQREQRLASALSPFSGGAPNLKRLDMELASAWPPVENVTHLLLQRSINPLTYRTIVTQLSQTANLTTLFVHHAIDALDWFEDSTPLFHLPKLESLSLALDGISITNFILKFAAPNLTSLWYHSNYATGDALQRLSRHYPPTSSPFPKLQYLTIQSSLQHLPILEQVFPSITTLHICHTPLWAIRFYQGLYAPDSDVRWPKLQTLVIRNTREGDSFEALRKHLINLARARLNSSLPLKAILLDTELLEMMSVSDELTSVANLKLLNVDTYEEPIWKGYENDGCFRF